MSKKEERDKGAKKLFEEIMAQHFPNSGNKIDMRVQKAHRVPNRMKTKNFTSRDIIIKTTRIKQNLKATRDTQIVRSACVHVCVRTYTHTHTHTNTQSLPVDFSAEMIQTRG